MSTLKRPAIHQRPRANSTEPPMSEFAHLPLAQITASLTNPRKTFDPAKVAKPGTGKAVAAWQSFHVTELEVEEP